MRRHCNKPQTTTKKKGKQNKKTNGNDRRNETETSLSYRVTPELSCETKTYEIQQHG